MFLAKRRQRRREQLLVTESEIATRKVLEEVRAGLSETDAAFWKPLLELPADPPSCPNCGRPMRKRVAKRRPYKGNPFWGCSTYPRCTGLRQR